MRWFFGLLAAAFILGATPATVVGTWQGVIDGPVGKARRVMTIGQSGGQYSVVIHSIDESDVPIVTHNVRVEGRDVTMIFDMNASPWIDYHRVYHATLSPDGRTLSGLWSLPRMKPIATRYERVAKPSWPLGEPTTHMVEVQPGVHVEALDWGGNGRPMLLLAGLGNTGHDFFPIIDKLRAKYHVYSMTRRGFGNSTVLPAISETYNADRLGDDVVAVMDALHIVKPILVGHSIAGEELSDIGTRYRQKVAALIYLDAGYWYAMDAGYLPPWATATPRPNDPNGAMFKAFIDGAKHFKGPIDLPILAIYAYPRNMSQAPAQARTSEKVQEQNLSDKRQIDGFKKQLPNAEVIEIAHADHFLYLSNRDEVLRDIDTFTVKVPRH